MQCSVGRAHSQVFPVMVIIRVFFELAIFPTTQKSFLCILVMVLFGGHICHTVNFLSGEMKNDDDLMKMLLL